MAAGDGDSSGHTCPKRPDNEGFVHDHGPTAGKWPLSGAGKGLVDLPNIDRIIEKARDGCEHRVKWEISTKTLRKRDCK